MYDDKRKKSNHQTSFSIQRNYEYNKLMRIIKNRYSYSISDKNKDDESVKLFNKLPWRYIEKVVAESGIAAIYKDDTVGIAAYRAVMSGGFDIYGIPKTWTLYTANGHQIKTVENDDEDLILLRDFYNGEPLSIIAHRYADLLGKIRETLATNVNTMRVPYLIRARKERKLEVEMALFSVKNESEVIVDDDFEFEKTLSVVDLKTPDNLESLEVEYHNVLSRFLEEVGFSSVLITKKERLVSAEADANGSTLIAFDNEPYENRLKFVKALKSKYNIEVNLIKSNIDILRDYGKTTETRPVVDKEEDLQ